MHKPVQGLAATRVGCFPASRQRHTDLQVLDPVGASSHWQVAAKGGFEGEGVEGHCHGML